MKTIVVSLLAALACLNAAAAMGLFNPHIAGGGIAVPHSHPHMVRVLNMTGGLLCGGSLVADKWALTAGHCCTRNMSAIQAGLHDWTKEEPSAVVVPIKTKHLYEGFQQKPYRGDICLLELRDSLSSQISEGKFIKTIRLPKKSDTSKVYWGSPVTLTGWGKVQDKFSPLSPELKELNTTVLTAEKCKTYLYLEDNYDDVDQICTSGRGSSPVWGIGPCFGDSGGPLTQIESDGERTQIGVFSYVNSVFECINGGAAAWTRVTTFLNWIEEVTNHEVPIRP